MPRTQEREYFIRKTRKPQGIIPVGSHVQYFNSFTGERDYVHLTHAECDREFEKRSKNHDQS